MTNALLISADTLATMTTEERIAAMDTARSKVYAVIRTEEQYGYGHVVIEFACIDPTRDAVYPSSLDYGRQRDLEGIGLRCQISRDMEKPSYAWEVGARTNGDRCIELHKLEPVVKRLKAMEKAAGKVAEIAGRPMTYGAFVGHQVSGLKLAGVLIHDDGTRYRDKGWHVHSMADLVSQVDSAVRTVGVRVGRSDVAA